MKFDAYAALAKLREEGEGRATPATCATRLPEKPAHVAQVARVARPPVSEPEITPASAPEPSRDTDNPFRHGRAPGDRPVTWCGKIVSLDEWRRLSAWDRHGPDGRLHCGICKTWVTDFPACHGEREP